MHITRFTDYSLRVLMYLALKEGQPCTISEISDRYQISKSHLMKIVQELNAKDFIIATRGKNGGIKLKGHPASINLGHLIRTTEQDLALVECFGEENQCSITPGCELKKILAEALSGFFEVLDKYTLVDLLQKKNNALLRRILLIEA